MQVYAIQPSAKGLRGRFATCLQLKINVLEQELQLLQTEAAQPDQLEEDQIYKLQIHLAQERMGLAALLIEQERYEDAALLLRAIVSFAPMSMANNDTDSGIDTHRNIFDKACAMLYRTKAALCDWKDIQHDSQSLMASVSRHQEQPIVGNVPPLHPFEALKWPCISLEQATYVAQQYASRAQALASITTNTSATFTRTKPNHTPSLTIDVSNRKAPPLSSSSSSEASKRRLRLGYLSPDFTIQHPLAFLMADVFRCHDRQEWEVFVYSMTVDENEPSQSPQVQTIREGADHWIELQDPQQQLQPKQLAQRIQQDKLDVMIDLCGHSGTSTVMELMAHRLAPVQASYMGFPGSTGAPAFIDYLVCDATVLPYQDPTIRRHYPENLILMPDCYFVNSHSYAVNRELELQSQSQSKEGGNIDMTRARYNLPDDAFVYCCHSRPDKIDPVTFRSWCRVLAQLRDNRKNAPHSRPAVLWLLRSGLEMESNLRKIAQEEFGLDQEHILMADIAPRAEHLQRLALADLFLDTPAYNAHTVGCDALYAGVPMVTLLRPVVDADQRPAGPSWEWVPTDKWASRVGASLMKAVGLPDLIASDMDAYEDLLCKAATDVDWFRNIKIRLRGGISKGPLFDTEGWVRNLEVGLAEAVSRSQNGKPPVDIVLIDRAAK